MINAIIFDADGPLYYRTPEVVEEKKKLLEDFDLRLSFNEFESLYNRLKFKAYVGDETIEKMFQRIFEASGSKINKDEAHEFGQKFDLIQAKVTATNNAVNVLKILKSKGFKICVLTDSFYTAKSKWPWFEKIGLSGYLDFIVSSYDTKTLKDTQAAYEACLAKLKLEPDQVVFVGHQPYEMIGAKKAKVASVAVKEIAPDDIVADYSVNTLTELPDLVNILIN